MSERKLEPMCNAANPSPQERWHVEDVHGL